VERRRIPYERERWLSAVLIVTAIAGASVIVPRWPSAVRPVSRAVPHLPARSLPLIDSPGVLMPGALSRVRQSGPAADRPPLVVDAPAVAAAAATEAARPALPASVASAPSAGGEAGRETALLTSRRVALAGVLHPLTDDDLLASVPSSSHAFVEIPAVVVTRAVMVAGRGIRTGLRATSAVFRAAF
jgi:hypothetical protein